MAFFRLCSRRIRLQIYQAPSRRAFSFYSPFFSFVIQFDQALRMWTEILYKQSWCGRLFWRWTCCLAVILQKVFARLIVASHLFCTNLYIDEQFLTSTWKFRLKIFKQLLVFPYLGDDFVRGPSSSCKLREPDKESYIALLWHRWISCEWHGSALF